MPKWTVNDGTQVAWKDELVPEGRTIFATPEEIAAAGVGAYVTLVNEDPEPEPEKPKAKPAASNKARKASPNKTK